MTPTDSDGSLAYAGVSDEYLQDCDVWPESSPEPGFGVENVIQ